MTNSTNSEVKLQCSNSRSAIYQIYLHKLDADSKNGLLKFHNFKTVKAAGRIVLGVSDPLLFKELQSDNTPFIVAGDMLAEL